MLGQRCKIAPHNLVEPAAKIRNLLVGFRADRRVLRVDGVAAEGG